MATTKKASKKKASKKTTKKKATDDLIINVSHEVENYNKDAAYATVAALADDIDFSYFKVGGILNRINEEGWYADEEFDKFSDFVESTFGIKRSKAMYLINIYNGLLASGVAWDDVSGIGWSKLKEIVRVLTKKNVAGWVKRAKEMTVMQLNAYVKAELAGDAGDDANAAATPDVTSMTFKLHTDQKEVIVEALEKAKTESGTEFNNVALEAISMDYLAGPSKPAAEKSETADKPTLKTLQSAMENFSYLQVLETFEKIWPDVDLTVQESE